MALPASEEASDSPVCVAAPLTHLSGQPPGLPVGFGLIHGLADLLHQLVQLHCGLNQNRAELLPRVLMLGEKTSPQLFLLIK